MSRQQRRQAEREKAKRLAELKRAAPPPTQQALAGQAEVLLDILEQDRDGRRAGATADAAHAGYERSMKAHFRADGLACRNGCAHCCHAYVSVSAPEALLAARAVRALPKKRRAAVIERVQATDTRTRGLPPEDRKGAGATPCPLLDPDTDACTVYAARPLSCRAELSTDAEACARMVQGLDAERLSPVLALRLKILYSSALALAAKGVGLRAGVLEFNAALRIALEGSDTEARWLAGEDLFAPAAVHDAARADIDRALSR